MSFIPRQRAVPKPLIGILCCNESSERDIQAVATRFIEPLVRHSGLAVVLVPAVADALDAHVLTDRLDGLLLTGSRSDVSALRYGARDVSPDRLDLGRDEVALRLAGRMIEQGRPVFGICRGLQELNVLFGGTLIAVDDHHSGDEACFAGQFQHRHDIDLAAGGVLARSALPRRVSVNSVHHQAIGRLGAGLTVEAKACDDGIIEAISANPCGGEVLAVQWHPECDLQGHAVNHAFFGVIAAALATSMCRVTGHDYPVAAAAQHRYVRESGAVPRLVGH